jgi:hypothetical protein
LQSVRLQDVLRIKWRVAFLGNPKTIRDPMTSKITRLTQAPKINADWNKAPWRDICPLSINNHMGSKPAHFPNTQVKIAYNDESIFIIFRVEDRFVRVCAKKHQDQVCKDSCVEFFFTPGNDTSKGYFNIEVNCGGIMLFHFQKAKSVGKLNISEEDMRRIKIAHSLPGTIDKENSEPVTWTLEYSVPVDILPKYCDIVVPAPGAQWRANFYKCADESSHPHWLTWAPVNFPTPNFHLPEFFGVLEFT